MQSEGAKIINNDALVVLCLKDSNDAMSHHEFRVRAATRGFTLTKSACHNMLHRAMGRVAYHNDKWKLTVMGEEYRQEVLDTMQRLVRWELADKVL